MPVSPNINNYYIGKGTVLWTPEGGVATPFGNVPEFELTPSLEKLAHFSSMEGVKKKDREVVISQSISLRMILEEWTIENLQLALMGGTITTAAFDIFAVSEIRGAVSFTGTNDVGPQIDIELPLVSFTPSGSINPLSDEWGGMEITGEVLSVAGAFGSLTHRDIVVAP